MTDSQAENIVQLLGQTRIFLVLTVLMEFASNIIDPPYSTFGIFLNILILVILVFTLFRIHRSIGALKSSTSIL